MLISKAKQKLQLMRHLAQSLKSNNPELILNVGRALVTSAFDYGAPCFLSMAEDHWEKLE